MAEANNEISRWSEYDYVIVNDDIQKRKNSLKPLLSPNV